VLGNHSQRLLKLLRPHVDQCLIHMYPGVVDLRLRAHKVRVTRQNLVVKSPEIRRRPLRSNGFSRRSDQQKHRRITHMHDLPHQVEARPAIFIRVLAEASPHLLVGFIPHEEIR
jgi:hypothetical protein